MTLHLHIPDTTPDMPFPTVNLNGTDPDTLLATLREARSRQQAAVNVAPHGRDFQTQQPNRYHDAARLYRTHMQHLEDFGIYLAELSSAICATR